MHVWHLSAPYLKEIDLDVYNKFTDSVYYYDICERQLVCNYALG